MGHITGIRSLCEVCVDRMLCNVRGSISDVDKESSNDEGLDKIRDALNMSLEEKYTQLSGNTSEVSLGGNLSGEVTVFKLGL